MPHILICAECGAKVSDGSYAAAVVLLTEHCRNAKHPWDMEHSHVVIAMTASGEYVAGPEEFFKKSVDEG